MMMKNKTKKKLSGERDTVFIFGPRHPEEESLRLYQEKKVKNQVYRRVVYIPKTL